MPSLSSSSDSGTISEPPQSRAGSCAGTNLHLCRTLQPPVPGLAPLYKRELVQSSYASNCYSALTWPACCQASPTAINPATPDDHVGNTQLADLLYKLGTLMGHADTIDNPEIANPASPLPRPTPQGTDIAGERIRRKILQRVKKPTPCICVGSLDVPARLARESNRRGHVSTHQDR